MDPLESLPSWMDRYKASKMVQYRALGFNQEQIAVKVGVTQQTVSRYLAAVNASARKTSNEDGFLASLLIIGAGAALLAALLKNRGS